MKLIKILALMSTTTVSATAFAASEPDDAIYQLPAQTVAIVCEDSDLQKISKDEFNDFFAQAIPILQEIKTEGGLVGAQYLTDIRAGIFLAFKDSTDYSANENADRFEARIGEMVKEGGFPIDQGACKRYELGGQMM